MKQPTCEMCKSADNRNYFANAEALYALATEAYGIGDVQEAEKHCDKIIEIEPENPNAWMIKGAACAWQFSLENIKLHEFSACAQNAFNYSPNSETLNRVAEFVFKEFYSLCLAVNQQKMDSITPFNGECAKYLNTAEYSANRLVLLLSYYTAYGNLSKCKSENAEPKLLSFDGLNDMDLRIFRQIEDAAISMWYNAALEFKSDCGGHPSDSALGKIIAIYANVSAMLEHIIAEEINADSLEKEFVVRVCEELVSIKREALSLMGEAVPSILEYGVSADTEKYLNIIKKCDP